MSFDIVVAHDLKNGIGKNNQMPWHCKPDLKYFKDLTTQAENNHENTVIMGRKTWESLPDQYRPLPNRNNVVVSKTQSNFEGAIAVASFADALIDANKKHGRVFVIGGGQLYKEALVHPELNTVHVTQIFRTFDCDTQFPEYKSAFKCVYASNIRVLPDLNCAFFKFKRVGSLQSF